MTTRPRIPAGLDRAYSILAALQNPESPAEWGLAQAGDGWFCQYVDKSSGDLIEVLGPYKTPLAAVGAALDKEQSWDLAGR